MRRKNDQHHNHLNMPRTNSTCVGRQKPLSDRETHWLFASNHRPNWHMDRSLKGNLGSERLSTKS